MLLQPVVMSGAKVYPRAHKVRQPDGTTLTIIGHGDEYSNYLTTTDGYTVVRASDGFYRYAILKDGRLTATAVVAADVENRTPSDADFLYNIPRHISPERSATAKKLQQGIARNDGLFSSKGPGHPDRRKASSPDLRSYRGLVIMVNFNDRKFTRSARARQLVDDKMNKEGYSGFSDITAGSRSCPGSVRDYFSDNSYGIFKPEFDVVGPIELDVSQYYINQTERTYELAKMVLEAADKDVDYSRYDSDGDGVVDMFYILYAGYSSSYSGNDERFVWPHAGHIADSGLSFELDGMRFGRFACSSEIFGWEDDGHLFLDGIGVIVHEFSHVLGFKDHYDVSGSLNEDPGVWDIMAAGNYDGYFNDTPCGYNAYEKYAAGFLIPRTVTRVNDGENVTLRPISSSADALRIESMKDSTTFLMENRQPYKWDRLLPGHGMLIWRVDSCDSHYWDRNALNVNGLWHFRLIRAQGAKRTMFGEIEDLDCDPFPGTGRVSFINNYTYNSSLLSNDNYPSPLGITDIEETDGLISLILEADNAADNAPYILRIRDSYAASGTLMDDDVDNDTQWEVRTEVIQQPDKQQDKTMIYNLAPDVRHIAATDPRYAKGLGAQCTYTSDHRSMIIEPARVATTETESIWLVNIDDLEGGGSGGITFDMDGYGHLTLANPEDRIGYVTTGRKVVVPTSDKVTGKFGVVRGLVLADTPAGMPSIMEPTSISGDAIYNLQGIRVTNPIKGETYITGGRKLIY